MWFLFVELSNFVDIMSIAKLEVDANQEILFFIGFIDNPNVVGLIKDMIYDPRKERWSCCVSGRIVVFWNCLWMYLICLHGGSFSLYNCWCVFKAISFIVVIFRFRILWVSPLVHSLSYGVCFSVSQWEQLGDDFILCVLFSRVRKNK